MVLAAKLLISARLHAFFELFICVWVDYDTLVCGVIFAEAKIAGDFL